MGSSPFGTILVGVNGDPDCERAAQIAVSLAQNLRARLILLGVIAPLSAETEAEGVGLEAASNALPRLEEQLQKISESAREFTIDVVTEIVHGDPEKAIEQGAEQHSAELIVVGHRDVGRLRHWLEGSTSETLVQNSHASVLVVHDGTPSNS